MATDHPSHTGKLTSPTILPVGTAVVMLVEVRSKTNDLIAPAGGVGVVVSSPRDTTHSYRVRFPGGEEVTAPRQHMGILKHFQQQPDTDDAATMPDLAGCIIYRCVIGSRAYGLDHEASDYDHRGIYLPPAELQWSLFGIPEQLEDESRQECFWELGKFLHLALKANPNVLEVLYSPLVEFATPLARELLSIRGIFLSKLVYQTYNGYVLSQFKKLETDIRNHGAIKWKHAMHLIRLLLAGVATLREGYVPVRVTAHRDRLMLIRDGMMLWADVNDWRLELHRLFDKAFVETRLPDRPDYAAANAFLIRARRSMVR